MCMRLICITRLLFVLLVFLSTYDRFQQNKSIITTPHRKPLPASIRILDKSLPTIVL